MTQDPDKTALDAMPLFEKPSKHADIQTAAELEQFKSAALNPADLAVFSRQIRIKRESLNLTTSDIERRLKFPAKFMDAMEQGRWDQLPKGEGLKSFAKNYAKCLNIDPQVFYQALKIETQSTQPSIARHTSIRAIGMQVDEGQSSRGSLVWVVVVVVALIAVLALVFKSGVISMNYLPEFIQKALS